MPDEDGAPVARNHVRVYWLEQRQSDIPREDFWLTTAERAQLDSIRLPKRRADWRLGRWTAKCAVSTHLNLPALCEAEIRAACSGAPEVFIEGQAAPITISLSHREGVGLCAIADSGAALGCDLEIIEPRVESFTADYFTPEEQDLVASVPPPERDRVITGVWSAKESALKALRVGLRADTRDVIVSQLDPFLGEDEAWRCVTVRHRQGRSFSGWWQRTGNLVRTIVARPSCLQPKRLVAQRILRRAF